VISVAAVVIASGFGQFGAVAALGDVAASFGQVTEGASVAEQAGLSGTVLGLGLAVIRLASLASLPLAGLADRFGRKVMVLGLAAAGLALTASASLSPGYWWFVALFALSRPFLSATTAVAQVAAAEHTAASDRAKALALTAAGYGVGAALVAVVRGAAGDALGFRGLFALALVPLLLLPVLGRWMAEPDRYRRQEVASEPGLPVLDMLRGAWGRRLLAMAAVAFAVGFVTGPANSFVFVYGEKVVGLSPAVTAVLVVAALPAGLGGLALGRWVADRWGRRPCAVGGLVGLAAAAVLTYSGGAPAAVIGVLLSVVAGYGLSPALAAFAAELFPTSVRATVAGWLVAAGVAGAVAGLLTFGALADVSGRFGPAAVAVSVPALLATLALAGLPETRGLELDTDGIVGIQGR
jgi:MFS family permease